ncbi:MAG: polysaccharide deacetylase family protein [candidate division Zixibacteria bacterium]|nr:polysaccharide deacetylase family protein [candidate division Zixibacteria bacterium]
MSAESERADESDSRRPRILVFHKLMPKFSFGATNFSPQRFERLIQFLVERGHPFVSLSQPLEAEKPLPALPVAVCFDDAYSHLAESLPALIDHYALKPTVFVPTMHIGQPARWDYSYRLRPVRHLDLAEIKTLASLGVEFGSHGHSHSDLTRMDARRLADELVRSRAILEDTIGERVTSVSYPFGRCDARVTDAARNAGYSLGYTMAFPEPSDTPLTRGRLAVYGYDSTLSISRKINGGPLYGFEQAKARITNRLSGGTILYGRLFASNAPRH